MWPWFYFEKFGEKIARDDGIWHATNIEIYDYIAAYNSLVFSCDCNTVYNPSAKEVFLLGDGVDYTVKPGETYLFECKMIYQKSGQPSGCPLFLYSFVLFFLCTVHISCNGKSAGKTEHWNYQSSDIFERRGKDFKRGSNYKSKNDFWHQRIMLCIKHFNNSCKHRSNGGAFYSESRKTEMTEDQRIV